MTLDYFLRFVVYALATFRITHLLWWENGPFYTVDWLRSKAGVWFSEAHGKRTADRFWGQVLNCPDCLSVWVAAIALVALVVNWYVLDALAIWLAMSGAAMLCVKLMRRDEP